MVCGILGVPETVLGVHKVKTILLIILRWCLSLHLCVDIFTDGTNTVTCKTAGAFTQVNAAATSSTSSCCILYGQAKERKKERERKRERRKEGRKEGKREGRKERRKKGRKENRK